MTSTTSPIQLQKLSVNMPRSDSGNSSESCHSETDYEVENLINTTDDSAIQVSPLPLTKKQQPRPLSKSKKRPLSDITNNNNTKESPSSPSKAPRFEAESPSWTSTNTQLVPQYQKQQTTLSENTSLRITAKHADITPRMRAMLCDWMIEVCEVHNMHRQTYYLAVCYLDTYLLQSELALDRAQLQLLGITCLFIAAKLEEIHPAKVDDLAFLTDGACEVQDILDFEMIVLNVLKWRLHPTTLLDWLSLFLQHAYHPKSETLGLLQPNLATKQQSPRPLGDIIHKHFPDEILVQMMQLCDIITLDLTSLDYKLEELAAAVLYHFSASNIVHKATGYQVARVKPAITHVTKFALAVKVNGFEQGKKFEKVQENDWVNIQTHNEQLAVAETIPNIFEEKTV